MDKKQKIIEIQGALARGYCTKRNENKVLDPDLIEDMATEVAALDDKDDWVSVEDRLPDDCNDHLCFSKLNGRCVLLYCSGMWHVDEYTTDKTVTHWKPLPQPPKTEE